MDPQLICKGTKRSVVDRGDFLVHEFSLGFSVGEYTVCREPPVKFLRSVLFIIYLFIYLTAVSCNNGAIDSPR